MTEDSTCIFCLAPRASYDNKFCTNCGRELSGTGNFLDLSKTTANYDPMHPARKPWREPVPLRIQKKDSRGKFYNQIPWGKVIPPPKILRTNTVSVEEDKKTGGYVDPAVFLDGVEFNGICSPHLLFGFNYF